MFFYFAVDLNPVKLKATQELSIDLKSLKVEAYIIIIITLKT